MGFNRYRYLELGGGGMHAVLDPWAEYIKLAIAYKQKHRAKAKAHQAEAKAKVILLKNV